MARPATMPEPDYYFGHVTRRIDRLEALFRMESAS